MLINMPEPVESISLGKKSDPTFQNKTTIGKNLYQYNRYRHRSLSLDQTYEIKSLIGPDT